MDFCCCNMLVLTFHCRHHSEKLKLWVLPLEEWGRQLENWIKSHHLKWPEESWSWLRSRSLVRDQRGGDAIRGWCWAQVGGSFLDMWVVSLAFKDTCVPFNKRYTRPPAGGRRLWIPDRNPQPLLFSRVNHEPHAFAQGRLSCPSRHQCPTEHPPFVVQSLSHVWFFVTPRTAAARLLWSPLSPSVCSNSCPLSKRCYLIISFPADPFSFYLQSFPASGSFQWVGSSHQVAKLLEIQLQL